MEEAKEGVKITKDMTFAEVMGASPEAMEKLSSMGLMCGGCPLSQMETIEGGAFMHGMDPDELLEKLNEQ